MPPKRKAAPKAKATANASAPAQKKARVAAKKAAPQKPPTPEPEDGEDSDDGEAKDDLDSDDESVEGGESEDLPKDPQIRARMRDIKRKLLSGVWTDTYVRMIIRQLDGYMGQRNVHGILNGVYRDACMGNTNLLHEWRAVKGAYYMCRGGCGEDSDEPEDPADGNNALSEKEGKQLDKCDIPRDFEGRFKWCVAHFGGSTLPDDIYEQLYKQIPALPGQEVEEDDDDTPGKLMDNFDARRARGDNLVKEALLIAKADTTYEKRLKAEEKKR